MLLEFVDASNHVSESVTSMLRQRYYVYDRIRRIKRDLDASSHTFISSVAMTEATAVNTLVFNEVLKKGK